MQRIHLLMVRSRRPISGADANAHTFLGTRMLCSGSRHV